MRFLISHPESDALFESSEWYSDGLCEDVTGIEFWENEFKRRQQMIITQISISYRRTINLGNYESASFECTMTGDLETNDEPEQVAEDLRDRAREQVRLEVQRLTEAMNS